MNIFGGDNNSSGAQEMLGGAPDRRSFVSHVFSTTDEGKAEVLNIVQYASLGIIPIVALNKLIQRFVPEADTEKSSLELVFEVLIQVIIMFCGIVLVHRVITFIPTYSGFKYEHFNLTTVILAFLMVVLSIQTKLGIKVSILADRVGELWSGPSQEKKGKRRQAGYAHVPSQADTMDTMFPPAPINPTPSRTVVNNNIGMSASAPASMGDMIGPMAANSLLGSAFGSLF